MGKFNTSVYFKCMFLDNKWEDKNFLDRIVADIPGI
jgi:hypothetical protein